MVAKGIIGYYKTRYIAACSSDDGCHLGNLGL
jgi:hypothetical protein